MSTMTAVQAKSRLGCIWRSIVPFESEPQFRIAVGAADADQIAVDSLADFLDAGKVWLDGSALEGRPLALENATAPEIFAMFSQWEFVVLRDCDGGYWAILEEEYEWLVFTGVASTAEPE